MQGVRARGARPQTILNLSLPLPSVGERCREPVERDRGEGVLRHPSMNSGQALRMTFLFAMVSSHREPDERRTIVDFVCFVQSLREGFRLAGEKGTKERDEEGSGLNIDI